MPKVKTIIASMDDITDPTKRLVVGVIKTAVFDYTHPGKDPVRALDASVFLLEEAQTWASSCGLQVSDGHWEVLVARL